MYENSREILTGREAAAPDELRAVVWPELVARLAAQRDLRRVLLAREDSGRASFNAPAAALLAGGNQSKQEINRDALSDGNQPGAKPVGAACGAAEGDRETT